MYQKLSEEFIERHQDVINWDNVSKYQTLSEEFIEKHQDKLWWSYICSSQILSEPFMEKFQDKIDWNCVSSFQKLSEEFIAKFKDKVNWKAISIYQKLSEEFILEHKGKLNLRLIFKFQKLSEKFSEKHYKFHLKTVLTYQKLSQDFLMKLIKKINHSALNKLLTYQKLPMSFIKEHNFSIDKKDSWLYKNKEFKKEEVIKTGKYECHDDYFIAYKAIRNDRYSIFNFQYQYLPGGTYESTCDCTNEDYSFGLNVGTYDYAVNYLGLSKGIIVKCKVYYEDLGRIVFYGSMVRCFKITVLE